jgi:hypothetical protein
LGPRSESLRGEMNSEKELAVSVMLPNVAIGGGMESLVDVRNEGCDEYDCSGDSFRLDVVSSGSLLGEAV